MLRPAAVKAARPGRHRVHVLARPARVLHAAVEFFKPPATYDHKLMSKEKSNFYFN